MASLFSWQNSEYSSSLDPVNYVVPPRKWEKEIEEQESLVHKYRSGYTDYGIRISVA